ncbi:MAG: 30S ribosome-binding factor RbfA [Xanthomonadales bacterium]|nr:30S ribosome-binding factor RbfA [Xanthomonadales bacterium]
MSGNYGRHERVAGQLRRVLADLIWSEVKDPRLGPVSVTDVEVSRDLSHARVYVATSQSETIEQSLKALRNAAGFLRSRLGRELSMRSIPELRFLHDDSIEKGDRIEALLAKARKRSDQRDD